MEKFRVLIADDDAGMRLVLRKVIERTDDFELVGEADNGADALRMAEETSAQVVFLDVEMPQMTGVECARLIQDMDPGIVIVFATAHDDYMSEAFEVYAFDYLIKPFHLERVARTLERISDRLSERARKPLTPQSVLPLAAEGRMMLRHRDGVSFINFADILLVQREDRSTVLYTVGGERYVCGDTLGDMEERLPKNVFFRCHKSYIINLNKIKDITPYGRWTYIVRLLDTDRDALITHEKYEELERMFGG